MTATSDASPPDGLVADVFDRDCPSRRTMETVAGKWGLLALCALRREPLRFNALRRRVDGVSEKMLSQTLQRLERDGMVRREVRTAIPPHVEYRLSDLGVATAERLLALVDFLEGSWGRISQSQSEYDARRAA